MKVSISLLLLCIALFFISACNGSDNRFSVLKKCMVLGDESIIYARAHYVKLFYHFNPNKFSDSYKKIENFDAVTHKNTIDTYSMAIDKLYSNKNIMADNTTQNLLSSCKNLSDFSKDFVEENYRLAINHLSKNDPLTDDFFIEINKIVKFDHNIGSSNKGDTSFKEKVDSYQEAVSDYINRYKQDIPSKFIKQHKPI